MWVDTGEAGHGHVIVTITCTCYKKCSINEASGYLLKQKSAGKSKLSLVAHEC